MDEFEIELKNGFLDEAMQLLTDAEQCFLALESSPEDGAILEKIFRLAHNLKGSAKAVGFDELGEFTHELESFLLKLKSREIQVGPSAVSLLLRCNDHILKMVSALKADFGSRTDGSGLLGEMRDIMQGKTPVQSAPAPEPESAPEIQADAATEAEAQAEPQAEVQAEPEPETQAAAPSESSPSIEEVSELLAAETASKLGALAQASSPAPMAPASGTAAARESAKSASAKAPAANAPSDESIRVSLNRLEKLMNFVGELVILQTVLREQVSTTHPSLRKAVHQLGKVTKEVQDISMSLRMVPLKQTFQKMTRIVRDTSGALGKSVQLVLQGEDTEVDKTVLENLGDPLVHLIRNAVDHGIESADSRIAAGKPAGGTVWLSAAHQSGSLVIEIRDDGAGLDPEKLKAKAIEKGILKPGAQLSDREAYHLIFAAGFSTKAQVTDISGRGVGMDVVRTNIERLQGDISIDTELGKGTVFRVRLPLTLAIVDGMVIRSEDERYVIPLSHVHESVQPTAADVTFVTGVGEIFSLRGEHLPLYRLNTLMGRKSKSATASSSGIAIVVRSQGDPFAVLVDDILGQYQVVIKKLGEEHQALKGFSGSAILGDGRPALILELPDLVVRHRPAATAPALAASSPAATHSNPSIQRNAS